MIFKKSYFQFHKHNTWQLTTVSKCARQETAGASHWSKKHRMYSGVDKIHNYKYYQLLFGSHTGNIDAFYTIAITNYNYYCDYAHLSP